MENSYSQASQDKFVLNMLHEKRGGTFLEIGANNPITTSNTYLLEKDYEWRGLMIEYEPIFEDAYKQHRSKSNYLIDDARKIDYLAQLMQLGYPHEVDYLQIDLDVNNKSTLETLYQLDNTVFGTYRFATVTFEHDIYTGDYYHTQIISRGIFEKRGYVRIFSDVKVFWEGKYSPFEDWYVHPDLVDQELIKLISADSENIEGIEHEKCITIIKRHQNLLKSINLPDLRQFHGATCKYENRYICIYHNSEQHRLASCLLDCNFNYIAGTHTEDLGISTYINPRIVKYQEKYYVSLSKMIPNVGDETIYLWELNVNDKITINRDKYLCFNTIDGWPNYQKGREKNWIPWSHEDKLYYTYSLNPHRILEVDFETKSVKLIAETRWTSDSWWDKEQWVEPIFRLNSNPVLLSDGTYLSTFHTHRMRGSLPSYWTGFYQFEPKYPFKVLKISASPFMTPDYILPANIPYHPPPSGGNPFYPFSMILDGEEIKLTGGTNEIAVTRCEFNVQEIVKGLVAVKGDEIAVTRCEFNVQEIVKGDKMTVLFLTHKEKVCGVYQYGYRLFKALEKCENIKYIYREIISCEQYEKIVQEYQYDGIIYNFHTSTMGWLNKDNIQRRGKNIVISHECPCDFADILITVDASSEESGNICNIPRPLFNVDLCVLNSESENSVAREFIGVGQETKKIVPIIGSFGFGFANKGFDKIVQIVNEQYSRAIIKIVMPGYFGDSNSHMAKSIGDYCRSFNKKEGIKVMIIHDFLDDIDILKFLRSNTINLFLYDYMHGRGNSSVIDYALSVCRPIGISNSYMFKHIYSESIDVNKVGISNCIGNSLNYLKQFNKRWSHENLAAKFYTILANPDYLNYHALVVGGQQADCILRQYFSDYTYKGVMIEVGAYNPIELSTSYHFERNGWDVYCIEPNPKCVANLKRLRKNVIEVAVSDKNSDHIDFTIVPGPTDPNWMAGFSALTLDADLIRKYNGDVSTKYVVKVNTRTLNTICEQLKKPIDIVSISAEGGESDIILGFDIERYSPKVILIVNHFNRNHIQQRIESYGYKLAQKYDYNEFYVKI